MATSVGIRFIHSNICIFEVIITRPLSSFLPLRRCEEGLVRSCFVVGEEEDMAAENPLDVGQVRHPS